MQTVLQTSRSGEEAGLYSRGDTGIPQPVSVSLWLSPLLSEDRSSSVFPGVPPPSIQRLPFSSNTMFRKENRSIIITQRVLEGVPEAGSPAPNPPLLLHFRAAPSHPALASTIPGVLCPQTPSPCNLESHRNPKKADRKAIPIFLVWGERGRSKICINFTTVEQFFNDSEWQ